MKTLFLSLLTIVFSHYAIGQQVPIMVCNASGTSCTPYSNLDTAIVHASAGSYVYLPGGSFPINTHIRREIHLIGAGHYADSSRITGISQIAGILFLDSNSNNSSIEGIFFPLGISNNHPLNGNITISSCNFYFANVYYASAAINNFTIRNCVVPGNLDFLYGNYNQINNSIAGALLHTSYSNINNCILLSIAGCGYYNYASLVQVTYCNIKNSVIFNSSSGCYNNNNTAMNNIFMDSVVNPLGASSAANNHAGIPDSNIFVNAIGQSFSYLNNYHVKTTCIGHNGGDDATDIGIYGSSIPYKEGGVPGNPHIFFKSIGGATNSSGDLPVTIKVRAEN